MTAESSPHLAPWRPTGGPRLTGTGMTALRQLLPPPPGAGEDIDWTAAEARWGTRSPRDHMDFMAVYGVGGIGSEEEIGWLGFLGPFPTGAYEHSPDDFEDETEAGKNDICN